MLVVCWLLWVVVDLSTKFLQFSNPEERSYCEAEYRKYPDIVHRMGARPVARRVCGNGAAAYTTDCGVSPDVVLKRIEQTF